jgi:Thymidylate synthase complementing protein
MSIQAQVVGDSLSPQGIRLTTFSLKYPRWIHSEFMTHRMFSRNASSSRAVPSRRLKALEREYPLWWGANIPGMQSGARLSEEQAAKCREIWQRMADICVEGVAELAEIGLHKQWANRPLEWFTSISVLVSATSFANFFGVRWHGDAQPEIQELAKLMFGAREASTPAPLNPDEWHLPYVSAEESAELDLDTARRCSAARCARVSYLNHDGSQPNVAKDLDTYAKLAGDPNGPPRPLHASPMEHQATPDRLTNPEDPDSWQSPAQHGNFRGWRQFRKMLRREQIETFTAPTATEPLS